MKSLTARLALASLALLTTISHGYAEDDPKARSIIASAIKAFGGKKTLMKQKRMDLTDKGTFYGMGEGVPYGGHFTFEFPNRFRMEIENAFVIVNNGKEVWVSAGGNTQQVKDEPLEYQRQETEAAWIGSLIPLVKPNPKYELSVFGEEEIDGEVCDGVNVKRGERPMVTMFFSRKTGILRKFQTVVHAAEKGYEQVTETVVYSEYKDFDGVPVPMKTLISRDGEKYVESETLTVEFPESFDDSVFAKPE